MIRLNLEDTFAILSVTSLVICLWRDLALKFGGKIRPPRRRFDFFALSFRSIYWLKHLKAALDSDERTRYRVAAEVPGVGSRSFFGYRDFGEVAFWLRQHWHEAWGWILNGMRADRPAVSTCPWPWPLDLVTISSLAFDTTYSRWLLESDLASGLGLTIWRCPLVDRFDLRLSLTL